MNRFAFNQPHVQERFAERFRRHRDKAPEIIALLAETLEKETPEDWRFTESPASRFFIVHEETGAKFLGLSYRHSPECRRIVREIRESTDTSDAIREKLDTYVETYVSEILTPDLPVRYEIRTVFGKQKAEIGEEKRMFEQVRATVFHTIPLASKKLAARPNAVMGSDGLLWVRQYMNWVGMSPDSREYYLFHPLHPEGPDRAHAAIFSYSANGDIRRLPEQRLACEPEPPGQIRSDIFHQAGSDGVKTDSGLRTESYWRIPTDLDRRFIDLEFKHRYSGSAGKAAQLDSPMTSSEIIEFHFLQQIVKRAQKRIYKK